jgi:hypothetical protein
LTHSMSSMALQPRQTAAWKTGTTCHAEPYWRSWNGGSLALAPGRRCERILRPILQSIFDRLIRLPTHSPLLSSLPHRSTPTQRVGCLKQRTCLQSQTQTQIGSNQSLCSCLTLFPNPVQPYTFDLTKAARPRGISRGICTLRLLNACQTTNQTHSPTRLFALPLCCTTPQALPFYWDCGGCLAYHGPTRCYRRLARVGYLDLHSTRSSDHSGRCEA